jgi:hypothetical protein
MHFHRFCRPCSNTLRSSRAHPIIVLSAALTLGYLDALGSPPPDPCEGVNCDDGLACTDDQCFGGFCVHFQVDCSAYTPYVCGRAECIEWAGGCTQAPFDCDWQCETDSHTGCSGDCPYDCGGYYVISNTFECCGACYVENHACLRSDHTTEWVNACFVLYACECAEGLCSDHDWVEAVPCELDLCDCMLII